MPVCLEESGKNSTPISLGVKWAVVCKEKSQGGLGVLMCT
jgi:hypothetical protein